MVKITNRSAATIPGFSFGFVLACLFGLRRDLAADARRVSKRLRPVYEGLEHIPARGSLAIIGNHYGRPDLHTFWGMFAVTNAIMQRRDQDLTLDERVPLWLVQNQMPRQDDGVKRPDAFTRWLFGRVIKMYGFVPHDPLPENTGARASAIHTLLARATGRAAGQEKRAQPVAIFPEGRTNLVDQTLLLPPPGAGTLLGMLSRSNVTLLPAALYEDGAVYTVRFGPTFTLDRGAGDGDKAARDTQWATQAMDHIALLLPPQLRGRYLLPAPEPVATA